MTLETFEVSSDRDRLDRELIHKFLSQTYWARGRSLQTVDRSIDHSLCFGVYRGSEQVAFARLITDRAVFAYLADVFVVPEYRGRGLAELLIRTALDHQDVRNLSVILLRTRDAGELYAKIGFTPVARPEELMVLHRSAT